jgi:hypothetical protein
MAKAVSLPRRSGLSPTVTRIWAAISRPMPDSGGEFWGEVFYQVGDHVVEHADLVVEVEDAPGEGLDRYAGGGDRVAVGVGVGPPAGAGADQLHAGQVP